MFNVIPHKERLSKKRGAIKSFKARAEAKRGSVDKIADMLTQIFGTVTFLALNVIFFIVWLTWNTGMIPGLTIVDPYPFGLLTSVVSLEAIFLAIVVLISQNRASKVAELREEVDLYITTYAESEITKLMYLQTLLLEKNGIDISDDKEVQKMLHALESDSIEQELEKQL